MAKKPWRDYSTFILGRGTAVLYFCLVGLEGPKYMGFVLYSNINKVGDYLMPVVTRFYGIVIKMYFSQSEHGIPHFHAMYGEYNGVFSIETLEMMVGDLPRRSQQLIQEWAALYQNELLDMWETNKFKKLPGLE
jgi:hypothetical protein